MQRDMDLVRKILFYIEENYVAGGPEIPVHIDGDLDSVVYEHCILMKNDGLIGRILDTSALESRSCNVGNLTSEGFIGATGEPLFLWFLIPLITWRLGMEVHYLANGV